MIEAPPLTARAVEDILLAAPGLRPACVRLVRRARGYMAADMAPGWEVTRTRPILVQFHGATPARERQGLEVCRRTLRAARLQIERCWDPDDTEYLAVLGWEEAAL